MADENEGDVLSGLLSATDTLRIDLLEPDYDEKSSFLPVSSRHRVSSAMVDLEQDLPPVKDMPTLESILKEEDDIGDIDLTSTGINLEDILNEQEPSDGRGNSKSKARGNKHGSILRHVMLRKISAQVQSASSRIEAGLPTAMAVSSIIAVGTSHGIVLIFDPKQSLQLVLGTTAQGAEYGAVTALGINTTTTRLLCGHAKGQITMWDLSTGKCVRSILDAHPPGSAVLHVMFTDDLTEAVCSDSGGSVFLLTFKKVIGMRTYETQVVFSGSRGEVCALAPLHFHDSKKDHPLYERSLLALATLTKVVILALRPHFQVVFTFKIKGSPDSLPLLAWYFAIIQVSSTTKVLDPGRSNGGPKRNMPPIKQNPAPQVLPSICFNCGTQSGQMHSTPKGTMCNACYQFWRRTGVMRSRSSNHAKSDSHNARSQGKGKRKPPKGMVITQEALTVVSVVHNNAHVRPLETDIVNLKRQIQSNKQNISQDRYQLQTSIDGFRSLELNSKNNARWSNEELSLAVNSVRRYGKDFQAMADVLQNKTVSQCRNFFVNHRKRFELQRVLEEFEKEQGIVSTDTKDDDLVPSPKSDGSSVASPAASQGNPPPLTKPSVTSNQPMYNNQPFRNSVQGGLTLQGPPPLIKPAPTNFTMQVRLPTGISSPPPQLVTQEPSYRACSPHNNSSTPPLRPTKV